MSSAEALHAVLPFAGEEVVARAADGKEDTQYEAARARSKRKQCDRACGKRRPQRNLGEAARWRRSVFTLQHSRMASRS